MNEQQEESQALIAADRQEGVEHLPAQGLPDNNISNLSDREIWRHFETTKGSAIFHLGRYLQNLKSWQRLRRAAPALESIRLDLGKPKQGSSIDLAVDGRRRPPRQTPKSALLITMIPPSVTRQRPLVASRGVGRQGFRG